MSPRYIRRELKSTDRVAAALLAAGLAVGVGVLAYYVTRLMLSRESLGESRRGGTASESRREG
jgi:hypothetical protein